MYSKYNMVLILVDVMIIIVKYDFITIGKLIYKFCISSLLGTRSKFFLCVCVGTCRLLDVNHRMKR